MKTQRKPSCSPQAQRSPSKAKRSTPSPPFGHKTPETIHPHKNPDLPPREGPDFVSAAAVRQPPGDDMEQRTLVPINTLIGRTLAPDELSSIKIYKVSDMFLDFCQNAVIIITDFCQKGGFNILYFCQIYAIMQLWRQQNVKEKDRT